MKNKFAIALFLAFIAVTVKAQQGGQGGPGRQGGMTPEMMAQRETDWMKTELALTSDQITKVDAINLKFAKEQATAFQGGPGGDPSAMQKQMADLNARKRAELEPVLTAEQLKKYDTYMANRQQRGPGGPGGPGQGGPGGPGGPGQGG
jgi:Spy/CpxP family protein refolding chaperone